MASANTNQYQRLFLLRTMKISNNFMLNNLYIAPNMSFGIALGIDSFLLYHNVYYSNVYCIFCEILIALAAQ